MDLLNNPWFIGIGGGILSGSLVTLITRYLFSRRENREYSQKVVTANQEILYAVRPGISEGVIPSQDVLGSLITATAAKYGVDASDLNDSTSFANVLIKEVMDSSFLSASVKSEFCQKLAKLKPTLKPEEKPLETPRLFERSRTRIADYRHRMISMMSVMLGVMAALMTVIFGFSSLFESEKFEKGSKNLILLVPTLLAILVSVFATYSMWLFRFFERKRRERTISSNEFSSEVSDKDEIHSK